MVTIADADELIGLKEIGEFLETLRGREYTIRQIQRLVAAGLPVEREAGKARGYLRASRERVAAWYAKKTNIRHLP